MKIVTLFVLTIAAWSRIEVGEIPFASKHFFMKLADTGGFDTFLTYITTPSKGATAGLNVSSASGNAILDSFKTESIWSAKAPGSAPDNLLCQSLNGIGASDHVFRQESSWLRCVMVLLPVFFLRASTVVVSVSEDHCDDKAPKNVTKKMAISKAKVRIPFLLSWSAFGELIFSQVSLNPITMFIRARATAIHRNNQL